MKFLERVSRLIFGPQQKCLLVELFRNVDDATSGIVLEETGLPYGGVTTYRWWKTSRFGFFLKTHRSFDDAEATYDTSKSVQDTAQRFDELLSLIEVADQPSLKHYAGDIRDGVIYRICWGTKYHQRRLTVQNPTQESRHSKLVQQLKEAAWE